MVERAVASADQHALRGWLKTCVGLADESRRAGDGRAHRPPATRSPPITIRSYEAPFEIPVREVDVTIRRAIPNIEGVASGFSRKPAGGVGLPPKGGSHVYRSPGSSRSMSGTASDQAASDHSSPLVLNRRNCTYHAVEATSAANSTRPARESGVVFGYEIMKTVNSSSRRYRAVPRDSLDPD